MKLICCGSSSRGNGYILQGNDEVLLLEAGLPLSNVRHYINNFSQIKGCLVSHRHGDHAKYLRDFMKAGITCYANDDVWNSFGETPGNKGELREPIQLTKIGNFTVMPMWANHDVPCYAYLIHHEEMGKLLFLTDSAGFGYTFRNLRHVLIECNWSEDCLQQAVEDGRTNSYVANRSRNTHMGVEVAIDYLQSENIMETASEIVMLHLSHENSDANTFTKIMYETFHKPIYVAKNGLQIDLLP